MSTLGSLLRSCSARSPVGSAPRCRNCWRPPPLPGKGQEQDERAPQRRSQAGRVGGRQGGTPPGPARPGPAAAPGWHAGHCHRSSPAPPRNGVCGGDSGDFPGPVPAGRERHRAEHDAVIGTELAADSGDHLLIRAPRMLAAPVPDGGAGPGQFFGVIFTESHGWPPRPRSRLALNLTARSMTDASPAPSAPGPSPARPPDERSLAREHRGTAPLTP